MEQDRMVKMQQEIIQQLEKELLKRIGPSIFKSTTTAVDSNRTNEIG